MLRWKSASQVMIGVLVIITSHVNVSHANKVYLQPYEAKHKLQQAAAFGPHSDDHDLLTNIFRQLEHGKLLNSAVTQELFGISPLCIDQSLYTLANINSSWALQMIDATAKPQRGLMTGITNWLGGFDQCLGAKSQKSSVFNFTGKYCTAQIPLGPAEFQFGLCLPSGCTGNDTTALAHLLLHLISVNATGASGVCQEQNVALSTGAISALVVFSIIGLLCALGTLYDLSQQFDSRDPEREMLSNGYIKSESNGDHGLGSDIHPVNTTETTPLIGSLKKASKPAEGSVAKLLLCFSVYTNGWKLLSTNQPAGSLHCLHGLRFISMTWVILGHTLVVSIPSFATLKVLLGWINRFSFEAILDAPFSVDSFFLLSGLLTAYLLLRDFQKCQISTGQFLKSVPAIYMHRYIRLTPAYGFMLLFYIFLTFYLFNGPIWPTDVIPDAYCKNNSWANLVYLNNIYDPDHECAAWSWYLANDFQFFLITPFVVYLMYRSPAIGVSCAALLVLVSSIAATAVSATEKMGMGLLAEGGLMVVGNGPDYFGQYYVAPWCRYHPFGTGVIIGYILWRCNGKLNINRWLNIFLWLISFALCFMVVFAPYDATKGGHIPTVAENAAFNGWSRLSWSVGLGYVIIACCTGHGGWVNEFLSWRGFVPLSRMTYCAYLMHPIVIQTITFGSRNLIDYSVVVMIYMFVAYLALSYAVAFVWSVCIEAPFLNLDKNYITGLLMKKAENK